uniref:Uncharacterized protein n=1 Tax=Plectus sambesii TaxID=2011161 RepID=A0A914XPT4_9BILA
MHASLQLARLKKMKYWSRSDKGGQSPKLSQEAHPFESTLDSESECAASSKSPSDRPSCFSLDTEEHRECQQYFYSENTARRLVEAVLAFYEYDNSAIESNVCCLCTPAIAEVLHVEYNMNVTLLDIDDRFAYMPGYHHFDMTTSDPSKFGPFNTIIFDPPYFGIDMDQMARAVQSLGGSRPQLLVAFRRREEQQLLRAFNAFNLRPTTFALEYARVKPAKWTNYGLYANCDLIGIKRLKGGK